jgi:hypothetical protein
MYEASASGKRAVIPRTVVELPSNGSLDRGAGYDRRVGSLLRVVGAVVATVGLGAAASSAATVPDQVLDAVHGRVAGWAPSPGGFVAVYVDRRGGGWCGLEGASWRVALVSSKADRAASSTRVDGAMCGNSLAWVRAGRFSDGRHPEVAFMLWTTPSIGATTYIYRIDGTKLVRLAAVPGDKVSLGRGTITARFENAGRNPDGKVREAYRFENGRYTRLRGR